MLADVRALLALAVPLILTQLAQVALTTTDLLMIGWLGPGALAAGGLAMVVFNQFRTMGVGVITPTGNQVAAASVRATSLGVGPAQAVPALLRSAFALATLTGLVGILLMALSGYWLRWLGQDPAVVQTAAPMLLALAPGLLPCLWFQVIRQFTVGMGRPGPLLAITLVSVAVNTALDYALMRGTWGLPALGLPGVGLATTLVYAASCLAFWVVVRRDAQLAPLLSLAGWRAEGATLRRLWKLGLPVSATYGTEAGFFLVVALLIGHFGADALAAHAVVNQLIYIVFMVSVGLSHAASIGVSRETARGDGTQARRVARTALALGGAVMAAMALVYWSVPTLVLMPFLGDASSSATAVAIQLLAVAAILQCFDCWQNIGVGLLRGLDDTAGGFRCSVIGYWGVGLPAAWLLGLAFGLGPRGIWVGLLIGTAATTALLLRRFHAGLRGVAAPALSTP